MSITVTEYPINTQYAPADAGNSRLVNFTPFTPPPVSTGCCCWRPQLVSEFITYFTNILEGEVYDMAWIAETLAMGSCPPSGPYVVQAGIITLHGVIYKIWTGTVWNTLFPPVFKWVPSWLATPNYRSFKQ
jgi:hypothetical protein